jgi:hypothetical protein
LRVNIIMRRSVRKSAFDSIMHGFSKHYNSRNVQVI